MFGSDWPNGLPEYTWKASLAVFTQSIGAQPIEVREQTRWDRRTRLPPQITAGRRHESSTGPGAGRKPGGLRSCHNGSMITPGVEASPHYTFKHGPYSSHSLLLNQLPAGGRGLRLLDVGCASGYLSELLAARGFNVTAIDRAGSAARRNRVHRRRPRPRSAAAHRALRLHRLRGRPRASARSAPHAPRLPRRSPPAALSIVSLPNSGHWYFRWNVLLGRFPQDDRGLFDRTHLHFYTWDGWVDLLDRAGFRIEPLDSSASRSGWRSRDGTGRLRCARWNGYRMERRASGNACSPTSSSSARAPGSR